MRTTRPLCHHDLLQVLAGWVDSLLKSEKPKFAYLKNTLFCVQQTFPCLSYNMYWIFWLLFCWTIWLLFCWTIEVTEFHLFLQGLVEFVKLSYLGRCFCKWGGKDNIPLESDWVIYIFPGSNLSLSYYRCMCYFLFKEICLVFVVFIFLFLFSRPFLSLFWGPDFKNFSVFCLLIRILFLILHSFWVCVYFVVTVSLLYLQVPHLRLGRAGFRALSIRGF